MAKSNLIINLEYIPAMFILLFFRIFPNRIGRLFGMLLGKALYYLIGSARKVALINLDIAFKNEYSLKEKKKLIKECFIKQGITIFEFINQPKYSAEEIKKITEFRGYEPIKEAIKSGRGAIICSSHFSNWEWSGIATGILFAETKVAAIARPLDNPKLNRYVDKSRQDKNLIIIPRSRALKEGLRLLRNNGVLGLIMDQNQARGNFFVPFFGKDASTVMGADFYHKKTGAPLFFGWDERLKDGTHCLNFSEEIKFDGDIYSNTLKINKFLEKIIRNNPSSYFWFHPRWKKRPMGEEKIYKGIRV